MRKKSIAIILCWILLMLTAPAMAAIALPRIIGSNMVLQCNQQVPIWGMAAAGELISVRFAQQEKQATADAAGNWKLVLDPMAVNAKGQSMIITGSETIVLENILIGEVWLCSGQSNMEYAMRKLAKVKPALNGPEPTTEVATAHNPAIRIFLVNRKTLAKPNPAHLDWDVAEDSALRAFSAAGYFFAKELQLQLQVPVGMIETAVSGSRIEPWIPEEAFAGYQIKAEGDPGKFYEPMVAPLAPFALKGFLWYQGESNCFLKDSTQYTSKMQALINSWRTAWQNQSLPFYYTQIAPFYYSKSKGNKEVLEETSEAIFHEAQELVMTIPATGMIVTTDLNDDPNDLHPTYKWKIGQRLAYWALARTYGKEIVYSGPVYESMKIKGNAIEISFAHIGKGLVAKDGKSLNWFEIAGTDGKYTKATAVIKQNKVVVTAPGMKAPVAVRFAFNEAAQPNLYNKDGLPALAFRTTGRLQWTPPVPVK